MPTGGQWPRRGGENLRSEGGRPVDSDGVFAYHYDMERLIVTDALIEELVCDVAPLVEEATGWELDLPGLRSRALPRERGYEEILLGRLRGAGVPLPDDGARGLIERLTEYLVEGSVLAAYEPGRGELLVVRENVDESNLDGLRVIIAHELVHRAQHVNHGELFDRMDQGIREIFALLLPPGGLMRALAKARELQPIMTLLESHAHYVQDMLHRTRFPGARIESHFSLPALLLRLLGAGKVAQYRDGIPAVADAAARGEVEALYSRV